MKLYSYFRSSAAYRTRIALNLKGLAFETMSIHLTRDGGNNMRPASAPSIRRGGCRRSRSTPARYCYSRSPSSNISTKCIRIRPSSLRIRLRGRRYGRWRRSSPATSTRSNNTGPLNYLRGTLKADETAIQGWYAHWVTVGFEAVEALLKPGPYAFGDTVTLADICIVPQVANARRFKVPIERFARIVAVDAAANRLAAFDAARPERQPDAE